MSNNKEQEMDKIIKNVDKNPSGLTLAEIAHSLKIDIEKRTLQRRIKELCDKNMLLMEGAGKTTRYSSTKMNQASIDLTGDGYIKLTPEGFKLREKLYKDRRNKNKKSVMYQADFLLNYIPNETFYLTAAQRHHLRDIGQENNGDQPAGTFAKKILDRLLIDLSWNSSRLEGNTYSLLDTERLILQGREGEGKNSLEARMITNHKDAIEFLLELSDDLSFNNYIILNLHGLLSKNLLGNPSACGNLRNAPVGIGKTHYQPVSTPQLIEEYFRTILSKANEIKDPFEQSFFAMVHLPYLQPFLDVNKRTSRLSANIPLIKHNCCPISFVDVPKQAYIDGTLAVYELNKTELLADVYMWAYERSTLKYCEAQNYIREPDPFIVKYSKEIANLVNKIVLQKQNKAQAVKTINDFIDKEVIKKDSEKLKEVIETHLLALHFGNIASYKVKPDIFEAWQEVWG